MTPRPFHAPATLALALSLFSGTASAAPDPAAPGLVLGPGDRVSVTVFGQPDLTGDHTLDSQGIIELPLGIHVAASHMTMTQLEQRITATLADGYIIHPNVIVRSIEWRPVYVLGDVRVPGAVPFRYGMTVLTALALAGGSAYEARTPAQRAQALEIEQRLEVQQDKRTALRARIARLAAQRDGAAVLEFPSDLRPDSSVMQQLLNGERAVFDGERAEEERQGAAQAQLVSNAKLELASLAEQLRLTHQQIDALTSYLADLAKLAKSGLVERRRVVDMQQEKSRLEADVARLDTQALHAAQTIQDAPLRTAEIRAAARQQALVSLQEANARLTELDTGIQADRELTAMRRLHVSTDDAAGDEERLRLQLTRSGPDGTAIFAAQESMGMLPGDVLRISSNVDKQASSEGTTQTLAAHSTRP